MLQGSCVSHDTSMDLGHGLNWMRLSFRVDYILRLKWMFWRWHSSHYQVSVNSDVWCMLAFYGKVSSQAEAVSQESEVHSDLGCYYGGNRCPSGLFAKACSTIQLLAPILTAHGKECDEWVEHWGCFSVQSDPDIPHEDTAWFPGQRCESGSDPFSPHTGLKESEKVPAELMAWALDLLWLLQVAMRKVF